MSKMGNTFNQYGQPIGESLTNWSARPLPDSVTLQGTFCRLEPLNAERHASDLYAAYSSAPDGRDWTYMSANPFEDAEEYRRYAERLSQLADPRHFAVIDMASGKAVGNLALMRIDPGNGVIEVGHVAFSPLLKQQPAATEAQFLLMKYVFDVLQYRRYEWKCDSLNAPSRKAAERLGFRFEGIFRQAIVYKGRTRDTAWHSILDKEWPSHKAAFLKWLSADNFDSDGKQIKKLADGRDPLI
jgi:RimJ/RimL family protein N-acetyltransferase